MMDAGSALLLSVVIVITILVSTAYTWYNFTGWKQFNFKPSADAPSWAPSKDADVSRLRFKGCIFSVARPGFGVKSINVDKVLNSMAVAYKSGVNTRTSLKLTGPLNPFSFVIVGFNDRLTVPLSPDRDPTWANSTVSLTGKVRTI
jgi:hypothetical protein